VVGSGTAYPGSEHTGKLAGNDLAMTACREIDRMRLARASAAIPVLAPPAFAQAVFETPTETRVVVPPGAPGNEGAFADPPTGRGVGRQRRPALAGRIHGPRRRRRLTVERRASSSWPPSAA
jgi:hypothetical protein